MSDQPFWAAEDHPKRPLRVENGVQIHSSRGTVARTWWSRRFLAVLEELGVGGRLARGRSYARSGQIVSCEIDAGSVVALVQGTRPTPYKVRIGIPAWGKEEWGRAEQALAADAWYAATLLAGGMPTEIEELFAGLGLALFPTSQRDLTMDCTCPDATVPCKHLAAVFYLLAERFDADPFEVLALRGRDKDTLLANLRRRRGSGAAPEPEADRPVTPLGELLDSFYEAPAADLTRFAPARPAPGALLDQVSELPIAVRGRRVRDLLRPAYTHLAAD
ncbi:SWIM zinc finger family protein [Pseudonocardia xishanensis]|uniref:SWIM zinc finger family protein n=1 Tax=Pseudonocardia xishanensis TaxID=630995 RepID=A0ABP8S0F5_9PSEU